MLNEQRPATDRRRTVREWRALRRMTKTKVALQLGVHVSTYTRMEESPEDISLRMAVKLSDVFNCDTKDIIFFEENPNTMLESIV